jgi:hypothetical protein
MGPEGDARTRAHSQSFAKRKQTFQAISHEVLLECDTSSHRFYLLARSPRLNHILNANTRVAKARHSGHNRV